MNTKQNFLSCAILAGLSGLFGQANAEGVQTFPGSKVSLSPLPVEIYSQTGQKPIVAFSTPCIQIERMTNGFPPILAFEKFMFEVIGNVNQTEVLPIKLEPVCI